MYAGLFALLLVAAIVTIPHALADNSDKTRDSEQKGKNEQKSNKELKSKDEKAKARDEKAKPFPRPVPKPIRQTSVATGVGVGAAIDSDGNLHRSHYRLDLAATSTNSTANTNSTGTNSTDSYQVKKGQIFILDKGVRGTWKIVPNTWKIDITDGKTTFTAAGQVKGGNSILDVSLVGTKIRDVNNASLYRVDGKMGGNSTEYELHYISTFSKKNRTVEPLADAQ